MKFYPFKKSRRIHLDYASTTPVHKDVFEVMRPYFMEEWANPSAIYTEGIRVREIVEDARALLARQLHVRPSDVMYTSGGTESNNLAIIGYIEALHSKGEPYTEIEIISTYIEHPSITETLKALEKRGVVIKYVSVDEHGRIHLDALQTLFSANTKLVTFAYVNSEIGVVQDVKKISRMVRAWNEEHKVEVRVHIDACQAPLWLPCALDTLGVDMLSLDAGKCYGPKGVGVLVKRHWVTLEPILFGGGQEYGLRSGTENVSLITGCTHALRRAQEGCDSRSERVQTIRDYGIEKIRKELAGVVLNGSIEHRVANNINISVPGVDGEYAVITLDAKGVAASTRSACGAGKGAGSYVVRTISNDNARALSTIRLTLGEETTNEDIDTAIQILKEHITKMIATGIKE